jgi:hypothetical protein
MKQLRLTILLSILTVTAIVFYRQVFIVSESPIVQYNQPVVLGVSEVNNGLADNGYFRAQAGTYWIYEGQGSDMDDGVNVNNYKIKLKNEVISVSGAKNDYLLKIKTTNLIDMSTKESAITIKNDYVVFDAGDFYNYVKFPLEVGNRWPVSLADTGTESLRVDGFYQNWINWKLGSKVLSNDCYNIIEQTLPDTSQTIWCDKIGPIQHTYHHNGSLIDESIKLTGYHF